MFSLAIVSELSFGSAHEQCSTGTGLLKRQLAMPVVVSVLG